MLIWEQMKGVWETKVAHAAESRWVGGEALRIQRYQWKIQLQMTEITQVIKCSCIFNLHLTRLQNSRN